MASAGNDKSEGAAPGHGGDGGDWTNWLRSRLERVAAPERRQNEATEDEGKSEQDRAGAGASAAPAARLPPSEQEPGPDLGLRLQWPSHPLEPSAGARDRTADDRRPDAETAGSDRPAAPASPAAPATRSDAPAPAQGGLPRIDAPVARTQTPPSRPEAPAGPTQTPPSRPEAPAGRSQTPPSRPDAPPARPAAPVPGPQEAGDERPAPSGEATPARYEATTVPPGARALSGLAEPLAAVPAHELVAGLDRLQSAVTSLSARVDGLADATVSFRSVMNERLDEYTETVLRAAKGSASDVQEYRRMHTASLGELRRNAHDTAETLRRLTGWMEELARVQGDDERWATALSQAFEEAAAERQEGEEQANQVVSTLAGRLEHIEGALAELAAEPADSSLSPVVDTLVERLERIDQALGRLGDELAAEPADSSLSPVVDTLVERLERIDQALGRLGDELAAEPADSPLSPVIDTLVERLERIEGAVAALGDEAGDRRPAPLVLDDESLHAIAAVVADRLHASTPAAAPEPETATTRSEPPAAPAPPAPPRARRTTPIRAPSRSRSGR